MGKKEGGKPKGAMTSYACFVQACRDEHKKKHPSEQIVFSEFSKKCSERWKAMNAKEKKRFEDMALKDKGRYEQEMADYVPPKGEVAGKRKKKEKDPNAPKRALSAFFFFCNEFRAEIKKANPSYGVGDIAKELGKRWETVPDKAKYEAKAARDKERYEKDIAAYKAGGGGSGGASAVAPKKPAAAKAPPKKAKVEKPSDSEDEDDDDLDDDDDDDDDDDE